MYSLKQPYSNYNSTIFCPHSTSIGLRNNNLGSHLPTYLKKLQVLQNTAIRIIIGVNYYDNVDLAYIQLKILKIDDL